MCWNQTWSHTHVFTHGFYGTEIFGVRKGKGRQMRRERQPEIRLERARQRNRRKKWTDPEKR